MTSAVATVAPPTSSSAEVAHAGYFQNSLPGSIILVTFWLITLPLAAFICLNNNQMVLWLYLWLFGMTHFVLTFTVYLNRGNLNHFASTWRNRLIYFVLPIVVFAAFDLIHVFHLRETWPLVMLYFFLAVRFTDFNHCARQGFGVLQMFKAATGAIYPKRVKSIENYYFKILAVLMLSTFVSGGVSPFLQPGGPLTIYDLGWTLADPMLPIPALQIAAAVVLLVLAWMLIAMLASYRRTRTTVDPVWADRPSAYLLSQTAGMLLATATFPLYAAALAMHYVEYQVLMYPRCFNCPLDEKSRLDRFFARLRRSPVVFYIALLAIAGIVTLFCFTGMGLTGMSTMDLSKPVGYLAIIALFDGLFVFHYLVEAYIWRFSEPYYRKSLNGLYFAPKAK